MLRSVATETNRDIGSIYLPTLSFDIDGLGCFPWVRKTGEWVMFGLDFYRVFSSLICFFLLSPY